MPFSGTDPSSRVVECGPVELLKNVPTLVWIGAAFAVLAVWAHDVRGLYIAGICIVVGTLQAARTK
jgi:hypothetical protein